MYFLKSEKVGAKIRLRPLSNQTFPGGSRVSHTSWVSADNDERTKHPVGTIFAVDNMTQTGSYYQATPLTLHAVTGPGTSRNKKYTDAYAAYLDRIANGEEGANEDGTGTEPPPTTSRKRSVKTRLEVLLAKFPTPTIKTDGYYIAESNWQNMLIQADIKENILLTGPTGSAKTEMVQLMAKKFGKTLRIFDMSTQQDPVSGLQGVHRINEKGQSYFDYARFALSIQEPNTWILLDEINRAPQTANNILFPVTDNRRVLELPLATSKGNREIPVHEDVLFFATANLGSEYSGTNQVDRALQDRFGMVELDYPPVEIEIELLVTRKEIEFNAARTIVRFCDMLRGGQANGDYSVCPSVRHSLRMAERVKKGMHIKNSMESVVLPLYDKDERTTVVTAMASII